MEIPPESSEVKLLCVDKSVPEPDLSYVCDEETLLKKKTFWKDRISSIKKVVAPMVDQSELAFRAFMRDHGAHLTFSPMLHAQLFVNDPTYRKTSFTTVAEEREVPFIIQFCANDPEIFLMACRYVEGFCDGVDLNLGCPQQIAKRGNYGAFLQERRDLIRDMVSSVYKRCRLPLSVKIRIQNSVEETIAYAKMAEEAGASMITIHGRRREQKGVNTGIADWSHIAAVIKELSIPVIANGNIQLPGDVERCLEATGADAVMSAEGILFNPLLFEDKFEPSFTIAREYLNYARKYAGNSSAVRAHIFRICHHALIKFPDLRHKLSVIIGLEGFLSIIDEIEKRVGAPQEQYDVAKQAFFTTDTSSLKFFVENTPDWFAKPYIRPPKIADNTLVEISEYRQNRKAEIQKISDSTGLSKRQIRKKERRRIDLMRQKEAKKEYPPCPKCSMPAAANCNNFCCKKCCRLVCIVEYKNCKSHKYIAEKLKPKREAFLAELANQTT